MNYNNLNITKYYEPCYYQVFMKRYTNKEKAINAAMEIVLGRNSVKDVLIYKVNVIRWNDENERVIKEQKIKELAVLVYGSSIDGNGSYIDYEE